MEILGTIIIVGAIGCLALFTLMAVLYQIWRDK